MVIVCCIGLVVFGDAVFAQTTYRGVVEYLDDCKSLQMRLVLATKWRNDAAMGGEPMEYCKPTHVAPLGLPDRFYPLTTGLHVCTRGYIIASLRD